MSGPLAYRPDRSEAVFVFGMKKSSYDTRSLIEFLTRGVSTWTVQGSHAFQQVGAGMVGKGREARC
jgi:hypothetical protein